MLFVSALRDLEGSDTTPDHSVASALVRGERDNLYVSLYIYYFF